MLSAPERYRSLIERLRLATLDGWAVDDCPLFAASIERKGGALDFRWAKQPATAEYILYRSTNGDPLRAEVVARGPGAAMADRTPRPGGSASYWVVAVPKLERMDPESVTYRGVPVAMRELPAGLPASMRMRVEASDQQRRFPYEKRNRY